MRVAYRAGVMMLVAALAACTSAAGPDAGQGGAASQAPRSAASAPPSAASTEFDVGRIEASVVGVEAGKSTGSGLVYRSPGSIITAAHVVGTTKTVKIGFADGTRRAGQVVAVDPVADLALIKVEHANLPAAALTGEMPPLGGRLLVLGAPLSVEAQVTAGVVSGAEWAVPGAAKANRALVGLVPMDTAVVPGHAGGPVLTPAGDVVGIAEVFLGEHGTGLGYVIPAATVARTADALLDGDKPAHAQFGAVAASVNLQLSQALDLGANEGAVLREVAANGPAAKAGLRPGDVVTSVNGVTVRSAGGFLAALRALAPGDKANLEVHRGAEGMAVVVTLRELHR